MTVECSIGSCDDCPCVRVRRRLTGEVARVEFGECGVKIVRIECDVRRDLTRAISMMWTASVWNDAAS